MGRRAREEQIPDVGARDEQDEQDGAEEHERGVAQAGGHDRRPRPRLEPPSFVFAKLPPELLIDAAGDRRQLRVGLLQAGPRLEPRQHRELADVARHPRWVAAPRNPQIRPEQKQAGRHHADDRRGLTADPDRAADDLAIPAEAALPDAMADDRDRWPVRGQLVRPESPAPAPPACR